jgi:hypothetical protein
VIYLKFHGTCLLFVIALSVSGQKSDLLGQLIKQHKTTLGDWAADPDKYDIQVIYTQIDRDANNHPSFTSYRWGVDPKRYFYPASTVKMPAAFLALEKLNDLRIRGLDKFTPMRIGAVTPPQTPVVTDTTSANDLPSLAHYAKKIFVVSDNDAFNRLYEWLGQAYFNEKLWEKGYRDTRILRRLANPAFDDETNRYTNPITLYRYDTVFYYQGEVYSDLTPPNLGLSAEQRGIAYLDNQDKRVEGAFDFSNKNYMSLQNLHDILKAVIFPEATPPNQRFNLTEDDYHYLYRCMSMWPRESRHPSYHQADNYVKFWIYGDSTQALIPGVRIFNKVGWSYGFLTDIAYIVDLEKGVEFFLSGTIHVNANQVYNDGIYEYDEIGLPFFSQLGKLIYDYELQRPRKVKPDLNKFRLKYD